MENLKLDSEGSLDEESEEDDIPLENEVQNLDYTKEKAFWDKIVIPFLVYHPIICPKCQKEKFKIYEIKKRLDIINPYYMKCSYKACRYKKNIRTYSFLQFAKQIQASIIYEILKLFNNRKKNSSEILNTLKSKLNKVPNYSKIMKILQKFRQSIAEFINYNYKVSQIGGPPKEARTVTLDEALNIHENNIHVWQIGAIDNTSKNARLDITTQRNATTLKNFVINHIEAGINIAHDG